MNTYATDGRCHNSNPGTYGHECGKPAQWIGTKPNGFRSGYCVKCRATGAEARQCIKWEPALTPAQSEDDLDRGVLEHAAWYDTSAELR